MTKRIAFAFFCVILLAFVACEPEEKIVEVEVIVDNTLYVTVSADMVDNIVQGTTVTLYAVDSVANITPGDLTYSWFSSDGDMLVAEGDTVQWRAPDEAGSYTVTVHATDGTNIGIGTINLGVEVFAATVDPYFVGDGTCAGCHSSTHTAWAETGHAHAWSSLMSNDYAASYCYPCHSVGFDDVSGNSGYDEAPILKFVNVQCESCHGPGSTHATSLSPADIAYDYDAASCGSCHEGSHHPYLSEWEDSPHNYSAESAHGAPVNGGCEGCHEGVAAARRLEGDLSVFFGGAAYGSPAREYTLAYPIAGITCQVCHDSHDATNPGQIRTVADVQLVDANGETPIITDGGVGKLCMQCHHARRAAESQIENGYAHFGPHANPQADFMAAKSAYHGVADASFAWTGPSHLNVQNSCKTCHINMVEYNPTDGAITGHTFEPTVEACANCHGTITSFDEIMALEDFDGDGTVEGVQSEVGGLLHLLEAAFVANGLDTTGTSYMGALGDTLRSTYVVREAGYNYAFVEDDKSMGVHNPDYAIQLLQQSYFHLTGAMPANAYILEGDVMTTEYSVK
ncbi:MAG: ammonia-forming cytochrome c nitrite reductase subunit c552 [Candidatus Marinimicrobia bacterium]|nr:ammonia-forming cytochrome c nitrite reductase subunit c552 [Candidatus Neomarinimicrobiota bacterium]